MQLVEVIISHYFQVAIDNKPFNYTTRRNIDLFCCGGKEKVTTYKENAKIYYKKRTYNAKNKVLYELDNDI